MITRAIDIGLDFIDIVCEWCHRNRPQKTQTQLPMHVRFNAILHGVREGHWLLSVFLVFLLVGLKKGGIQDG